MTDVRFVLHRHSAHVHAHFPRYHGFELEAVGAERIDRDQQDVETRRSATRRSIASVSVGIYQGTPVLDLDYPEDSSAETDMNVVMNSDNGFIEVQGTAEGHPYSRDELNNMLALAEKGITELFAAQNAAIKAAAIDN